MGKIVGLTILVVALVVNTVLTLFFAKLLKTYLGDRIDPFERTSAALGVSLWAFCALAGPFLGLAGTERLPLALRPLTGAWAVIGIPVFAIPLLVVVWKGRAFLRQRQSGLGSRAQVAEVLDLLGGFALFVTLATAVVFGYFLCLGVSVPDDTFSHAIHAHGASFRSACCWPSLFR